VLLYCSEWTRTFELRIKQLKNWQLPWEIGVGIRSFLSITYEILLWEFRTIVGEKIYSNKNNANENLPEGSKVCHSQKYLLCCKILITFSN
jgi:hypothetical protein